MIWKPHIQTTKTIYWLFGDDINVTPLTGVWVQPREREYVCLCMFLMPANAYLNVHTRSAIAASMAACTYFFLFHFVATVIVHSFVVVSPNISGKYSTSLFIKAGTSGGDIQAAYNNNENIVWREWNMNLYENTESTLGILEIYMEKYRWELGACTIKPRYAIKMFSIFNSFFSRSLPNCKVEHTQRITEKIAAWKKMGMKFWRAFDVFMITIMTVISRLFLSLSEKWSE